MCRFILVLSFARTPTHTRAREQYIFALNFSLSIPYTLVGLLSVSLTILFVVFKGVWNTIWNISCYRALKHSHTSIHTCVRRNKRFMCTRQKKRHNVAISVVFCPNMYTEQSRIFETERVLVFWPTKERQREYLTCCCKRSRIDDDANERERIHTIKWSITIKRESKDERRSCVCVFRASSESTCLCRSLQFFFSSKLIKRTESLHPHPSPISYAYFFFVFLLPMFGCAISITSDIYHVFSHSDLFHRIKPMWFFFCLSYFLRKIKESTANRAISEYFIVWQSFKIERISLFLTLWMRNSCCFRFFFSVYIDCSLVYV